jgi:spore coat protein CotF
MSDFLNNWFGNTANESADPIIAINSISATAVSASAYLMAALESTTPEVRRLFSEYSTQSVMANEAITELAINKKWMDPYQCPEKQLQDSINQSSNVLGSTQSS